MGIDLTGGKADDREFVFATQPDDPEMRESVNAWIWDSGTEVGMPRIGVEAVADQWDTHDIQVNIGTGDGRVFNMFAPGKVHDPLGADGKPRVLGAGPLSFELVEPFRHWRMRMDRDGIATHLHSDGEGSTSEGQRPDGRLPRLHGRRPEGCVLAGDQVSCRHLVRLRLQVRRERRRVDVPVVPRVAADPPNGAFQQRDGPMGVAAQEVT